MRDWVERAGAALECGPVAMVTVLATEGSAPRGPGARMLVTAEALVGTIGGGALEHQAAEQARAILGHPPGSWRVQDYPLGPLLGQCCGGRVRLMVERLAEVPQGDGPYLVKLRDKIERIPFPGEGASGRIAPRAILEHAGDAQPDAGPVANDPILGPGLRRGTLTARGPRPEAGYTFVEPDEDSRLTVTMFGAGHVGRAIAERAEGLPLHLAWFDTRAELAETPGVVLASEDEMVACAGRAEPGSAVVILTHDHALDYRLTAAALSGPAGFVGLIGSATKRARFLSRLAAEGIDAARLVCPIGLPEVAGKQPEVIAIGVLAQLLSLERPQ